MSDTWQMVVSIGGCLIFVAAFLGFAYCDIELDIGKNPLRYRRRLREKRASERAKRIRRIEHDLGLRCFDDDCWTCTYIKATR